MNVGEETKTQVESGLIQILPVLPIKNNVLYPNLLMPVSVGRPASIEAVNAALATEEKTIVVVAQRDASKEQPKLEDLYTVGTRAIIRRMSRSEQVFELLLQGSERVELLKLEQDAPFLKAQVRAVPMPTDKSTEIEALFRAVLDLSQRAISIVHPDGPQNLDALLLQEHEPLWLAFLMASMLNLELAKAQELLESKSRQQALQLMHDHLSHEVQVLELRQKIAQQAATTVGKEQREYMLRQQLRAIQDELGEKNPEKAAVDELRKRIKEVDLPEAVRKEAESELAKLDRMPAAAPDYQLTRGYLELITELPWRKSTEDRIDIAEARRILDEDHYGLEDVKERILEHLSVMKLNPKAHAPILCFVGPPGVGKTSLGQSIARSLGRKFERMSLGGLHDEAELRGHRRTYIGAMAGRIIQAIRRAGVNNPMLMLDEVDKLGRDFRGDPAAALLEILDPEQNAEFHDNYLDLPFDLSRVIFVTTANALDTIPRPLLDRMEVLRLSGYSQEEKLHIAKRFLIPRRIKDTGLSVEQIRLPDESIARIVSGYTREAGVRELERTIGRVARKFARRFAEGNTTPVTVKPEDLAELLGSERYMPEKARKAVPAGVVTGLAWTEFGGEVLYVEATRLPEGRKLRLTGSLGRVMRESAKAAQSYVWAHARELGIKPNVFRRSGLHVHVPSGAVPKDGPSAGVAMVVALTSAYTGIPASKDTAMTGEISLSGLVLPIGGVKEKVLAAHRTGIRRVILPKDNAKDVNEIPKHVRDEIEFIFAERIEDALKAAIPTLVLRKPEPVAV